MTFAAKIKTLKQDYKIWMQNPDEGTPKDFLSFLKITKQKNIIDFFKILRMKKTALAILLNNFAWFRKKRLLISALPGKSTHSEKKWLSPLTDWTKI